ncbi:MAG: AbrB/MazE/SpoVT family DNA-binding domain-containing protein [Candidatus Njordarchaeales archaeon]
MSFEVKKVDRFGRIVLPADWRKKVLRDTNYVVILKMDDELRILPLKRIDLRKYFDSVDLGVDAIGDWKEFEKRLAERGEK